MTAKRTGFLAIFSMALLCTWAVGFNVAPSPGSWALLETQDVSGVATVDFASLPTAYRDFKIIGSAVVPVSDGVALLARISIAASWKLGASDYEWQIAEMDSAVLVLSESLADSSIKLCADAGSDVTESISFELSIAEPGLFYGNISELMFGALTKQVIPTEQNQLAFTTKRQARLTGSNFCLAPEILSPAPSRCMEG